MNVLFSYLVLLPSPHRGVLLSKSVHVLCVVTEAPSDPPQIPKAGVIWLSLSHVPIPWINCGWDD